MDVCSRLVIRLNSIMFMPMEGAAQPPRRARATEPPSKWDYAKTFYYDPVKW